MEMPFVFLRIITRAALANDLASLSHFAHNEHTHSFFLAPKRENPFRIVSQ